MRSTKSFYPPVPPADVFMRDFAPNRIRAFAPRRPGRLPAAGVERQRLAERFAPLVGIALLALAVANVMVVAPIG